MDNISIATNSLFSVHGRRCLIIALFGIFGLTIAYYIFQTIVFVQIKDVLKSLDGDFARMMKEIHSLRENVTILETETEELKRLNSYNAQINMFTLVILCDQFALQKSALLAKKR